MKMIIGWIGTIGIWAGFFICLSAILLSLLIIIRKIQGGTKRLNALLLLQTAFLCLAVIPLAILLLSNAFEYPLVFNAIEKSMPWMQKLGGLWSGQAASLLFWSALMSFAALISMRIAEQIPKKSYVPFICLIFEFTLLFFIAPNIFHTHPFEKTWILPDGTNIAAIIPPAGAAAGVPLDGIGLNPSLRHPSMLLHPPFLYLGLIFFFIPYSFAISSLITGDKSNQWIRAVYPFALLAFIFLTIGMFLGSWWAYTILGWGGFWSWDAVEISGLLPWLLSLGLIYSMVIHLGGFPNGKWIIILSTLIIILILFGILLTRSGIIESVHVYVSGAMGPLLTVLILIHFFLSAFFLPKRWGTLSQKSGRHTTTLPLRIVTLLNIGLLFLAGLYLFGQTLPLTSQLFLQEKMQFTPAQYQFYSSPLIILLIILAGFFPVSRLAHANFQQFKMTIVSIFSASLFVTLIVLLIIPIPATIALGIWSTLFLIINWLFTFWTDIAKPFFLKQNPSGLKFHFSFGFILIHLAFALFCIGILGVVNYSSHQDYELQIGKPLQENGGMMTVTSVNNFINLQGRPQYEVSISFKDKWDGSLTFKPSVEYYPKMDSFYAKPATRAGVLQDVQVVLNSIPATFNAEVHIRLSTFPLMSWIWMGGILMALGGLLTWFYQRKNM